MSYYSGDFTFVNPNSALFIEKSGMYLKLPSGGLAPIIEPENPEAIPCRRLER